MPVLYFHVGSIPDEAKALSLLAPANAVAGILPGGGLLPTPNPIPNTGVRFNTHFLLQTLTSQHITYQLACEIPRVLEKKESAYLCHL